MAMSFKKTSTRFFLFAAAISVCMFLPYAAHAQSLPYPIDPNMGNPPNPVWWTCHDYSNGYPGYGENELRCSDSELNGTQTIGEFTITNEVTGTTVQSTSNTGGITVPPYISTYTSFTFEMSSGIAPSMYLLAVDPSDNFYTVATSSVGKTTIYKTTPSGTTSVYATISDSHISSLVTDSAGNLYAGSSGAQYNSTYTQYSYNIYKITSGNASLYTSFTFGMSSGIAPNMAILAVDPSDNFYTVATSFTGTTIYKTTPSGTTSVYATPSDSHISSLVTDSAGNLYAGSSGAQYNSTYTQYSYNIYKITSGNASLYTSFTFGMSSGIAPNMAILAVDPSDNFYTVATSFTGTTIYKTTPSGTTSVYATPSDSHISSLVTDSAGNLYAGSSGAQYNSTYTQYSYPIYAISMGALLAAAPGDPLYFTWSLDPQMIIRHWECTSSFLGVCLNFNNVSEQNNYFNSGITSTFGQTSQYGSTVISAPSTPGNFTYTIGDLFGVLPVTVDVSGTARPLLTISASSTSITTLQSTTINATYTPGSGDTLTNTALNVNLGPPTNNEYTVLGGGGPTSPYTYTFSTTTPGTYTFKPYVETVVYPSWATEGQSVTVTVTNPLCSAASNGGATGSYQNCVCNNTGTYNASNNSCANPLSCTFNGPVSSGSIVTAYSVATAPSQAACNSASQTFTCTNGTFVPTSPNISSSKRFMHSQ